MALSNLLSNDVKAFKQNKLFQLLSLVFILAWFYFYLTTRDQLNWWIENALVLIFCAWFIYIQRIVKFSDYSLIFIFLFLLVHIYGAQMSYTYNLAGAWLQNKMQLSRNPYDRFVHFSFGLFMTYPITEYLYRRHKLSLLLSVVFAWSILFNLAGIFELIEWLVAATTDSETGDTYVATQGDPYDAHKDIALAVVAATAVSWTIYKRYYRNSTLNSI